MPLIVVQPPTIKPESGQPPVLGCYFDFTDVGDALVGAHARLLIYDADLYSASSVGASEGDEFAGFRSPSAPLSADQSNPTFEAGNGVLLKADGTLRKTPKGVWMLGGIDASQAQNPDASGDRVRVRMTTGDKREADVVTAAYGKRDPSVAGVRQLLVRLVLVDDAAGLPARTVLASNLNPQNSASPSPIQFLLDAREGKRNASIGQPSAPSDIQFEKPKPDASRLSSPDVTGFYDSTPAKDGENSALLLQLNQAGRVVVGWFTAPPTFISNASRIQSLVVPPGQFQVLLEPGVLVVHLDEKLPSGSFLMKWMTQNPNSATNIMDPDDISFAPNASRVRVGEFRIDPPTSADGPPAISLKFDSGASAFDSFTQTKLTPRWSTDVIDGMPKVLADNVLMEQVRPAPLSDLKQSLLARFFPAGGKTLADLLNAWDTASNKFDKIAARDLVAQRVDLTGIPLPYRTKYAERLRAFASSNSFTLTATSKPSSIMEALRRVAEEEWDSVRAPDGTVGTSEIKTKLDSAGISPVGDFIYRVTFEKRLGHGVTLVVKYGLWGFTAGVSGFQVVDKQNPDASKRQVTLFDEDKDNVHFDGIFGDIGIGLGVGIEIGVGLKAGGGGALVGKIDFQTFARLTPQDFANANFSSTAVKGPGVSFGAAVSVQAGSSAYVEMRLTNGVILSAVAEGGIKFGGPDFDAPTDPTEKGIKGYLKERFSPELEIKLASASWGSGIFIANRATDLIPRVIKPPHLDAPLREEDIQIARRETSSFFAVDSYVIDEHHAGGGQSVRLGFEEFLAIDRAMLQASECRLWAFGFASPEHNEVHNQVLAENRAQAVVQAARDAFGDLLTQTDLQGKGLGEAPAKDAPPAGGGLLDPPDDPSGRAKFVAAHPDQVRQWPSWRRVDVSVEGVLIARLRTEP